MSIINPNQPTNTNFGTFTKHDLEVILFHVFVAMILGGITYLSKVNFGSYTGIVLLLTQTAAEALRRYVA